MPDADTVRAAEAAPAEPGPAEEPEMDDEGGSDGDSDDDEVLFRPRRCVLLTRARASAQGVDDAHDPEAHVTLGDMPKKRRCVRPLACAHARTRVRRG